MDKKLFDFDKDKPLFMIKFSVMGLSRQRVDSKIREMMKEKSDDVNLWFLPSSEENCNSDIKLLWAGDGQNTINHKMMEDLLQEISHMDKKFLEKVKANKLFNDEQIAFLEKEIRCSKINNIIYDHKEE